MNNAVKIIECPRDAWQGLPAVIPAEAKAGYLRSLINAGFAHIDAVSFVSPQAVPQMADSERVLELLKPPEHVEIIGIVVNLRGAERAIATGAVKTLGFPYSISQEFLRRNQNQTQEQSLHVLEDIVALATIANLDVVVYISMAFGNPYGEPWSASDVLNAAKQIAQCGVGEISLADTVGVATPQQIRQTVDAVIAEHREIEIGVHLHARRDEAAEHVRAAFDVGCRRFDSAIGGLGGCPFAQDEMVGNIPTEIVIASLAECGAEFPPLSGLDDLLRSSAELTGRHAPVGGA
ncbi:MAG TPA: hydroxymethylglutaryl-CoA lyase [Terracidiphilus sp.]|nr:hydroxymethylglutaryl-CoA lyase [Terracidiphilus sp.]